MRWYADSVTTDLGEWTKVRRHPGEEPEGSRKLSFPSARATSVVFSHQGREEPVCFDLAAVTASSSRNRKFRSSVRPSGQ